MQKTSFIR